MGLEGVVCDEQAYVYGYLPATPGCEGAPNVGFYAVLIEEEQVYQQAVFQVQ